MADYGLIGGLAQGLMQGLGSYQAQKQYNNDQALKQAQLKNELNKTNITAQHEGLIQNPDTGSFGPSQLTQAKQGAELQQVEKQADIQSDPTHPINVYGRGILADQINQSQQARQFFQRLQASQLGKPFEDPKIQQMSPEELVPQNLTINDIENLRKMGLDPALGGHAKDSFDSMLKLQKFGLDQRNTAAREGMAKSRADQVALQTSGQAMGAAQTITQDSNISKYSDSIKAGQAAQNVTHNPENPPTYQMFNDAQIQFTNAVSGAGSGTDSKVEATKYNTLEQKMHKIISDLQSRPDMPRLPNGQLDPHGQVPPEVLKAFDSTVKDFMDTTKRFMGRRAIALGNLGPNINEDVKRSVEDNITKNYSPGWKYGMSPEQWEKKSFGKSITAPVVGKKEKPSSGLLSGGQSQGFSPDVLNYAQQHGITPAQAQQIKIQRTGGQ